MAETPEPDHSAKGDVPGERQPLSSAGERDNPTSAAVPEAQPTAASPNRSDAKPPPFDAPAPAKDAADRKQRSKPQPVRSLVDLYTLKGGSAARLLRELDHGTSWKFADDDVAAALPLVPDGDPQLARTRQLVHESIGFHDGRFVGTAGDFALQVLSGDFDGLTGWPPTDDTEPVRALQALAGRLSGGLRNAKRQKRSHNALMIGVDLLSHRCSLSFESAAPVLRGLPSLRPEQRALKEQPAAPSRCEPDGPAQRPGARARPSRLAATVGEGTGRASASSGGRIEHRRCGKPGLR